MESASRAAGGSHGTHGERVAALLPDVVTDDVAAGTEGALVSKEAGVDANEMRVRTASP